MFDALYEICSSLSGGREGTLKALKNVFTHSFSSSHVMELSNYERTLK